MFQPHGLELRLLRRIWLESYHLRDLDAFQLPSPPVPFVYLSDLPLRSTCRLRWSVGSVERLNSLRRFLPSIWSLSFPAPTSMLSETMATSFLAKRPIELDNMIVYKGPPATRKKARLAAMTPMERASRPAESLETRWPTSTGRSYSRADSDERMSLRSRKTFVTPD